MKIMRSTRMLHHTHMIDNTLFLSFFSLSFLLSFFFSSCISLSSLLFLLFFLSFFFTSCFVSSFLFFLSSHYSHIFMVLVSFLLIEFTQILHITANCKPINTYVLIKPKNTNPQPCSSTHKIHKFLPSKHTKPKSKKPTKLLNMWERERERERAHLRKSTLQRREKALSV